MNEQLNNPTIEKIWPKWVQEAESALGHEYAPEFIEILAKQGFEVLLDWMKINYIPEKVIDLFQDVWMLKMHLEDIQKGQLQDVSAQDLAQIIPQMTERIAQLGGTFEYSDYESEPRQNVITWQPGPPKGKDPEDMANWRVLFDQLGKEERKNMLFMLINALDEEK